MHDRITLAVAMGWKPRQVTGIDGDVWFNPSGEMLLLPNPFTDANDDYAVLEWMRTNRTYWQAFKRVINECLGEDYLQYEVGDYARSALKVTVVGDQHSKP